MAVAMYRSQGRWTFAWHTILNALMVVVWCSSKSVHWPFSTMIEVKIISSVMKRSTILPSMITPCMHPKAIPYSLLHSCPHLKFCWICTCSISFRLRTMASRGCPWRVLQWGMYSANRDLFTVDGWHWFVWTLSCKHMSYEIVDLAI